MKIIQTSVRDHGADGRHTMNDSQQTDVTVARLLSDLPEFHGWDNRPLPRQFKQMIKEMDEQTLMSLTAHALHRITSGPDAGRQLPI